MNQSDNHVDEMLIDDMLQRVLGDEDYNYTEKPHHISRWIDNYVLGQIKKAKLEEVNLLGVYLLDERMNAWEAIHRRERELSE